MEGIIEGHVKLSMLEKMTGISRLAIQDLRAGQQTEQKDPHRDWLVLSGI